MKRMLSNSRTRAFLVFPPSTGLCSTESTLITFCVHGEPFHGQNSSTYCMQKNCLFCSIDIYRKRRSRRSLYQCCLLSFRKLAEAINAAYNHCLLYCFCVPETCHEAESMFFFSSLWVRPFLFLRWRSSASCQHKFSRDLAEIHTSPTTIMVI